MIDFTVYFNIYFDYQKSGKIIFYYFLICVLYTEVKCNIAWVISLVTKVTALLRDKNVDCKYMNVLVNKSTINCFFFQFKIWGHPVISRDNVEKCIIMTNEWY